MTHADGMSNKTIHKVRTLRVMVSGLVSYGEDSCATFAKVFKQSVTQIELDSLVTISILIRENFLSIGNLYPHN